MENSGIKKTRCKDHLCRDANYLIRTWLAQIVITSLLAMPNNVSACVASYSTFNKSGRAIADGVSEVNFQAESLALVIIIITGQLINC